MNTPLVSICIPAYNHEKFIQNAINSIIVQTYPNLELIIIDDGSSDNTLKKIIELDQICKKRFKRYYIGHQQNSGTSITLNKLISLSRGDFIFILASDDMAKPYTIKILADFLVKHTNFVLAVGDNEIVDSDSNRVGWDNNRNIVSLKDATYKTFYEFLQKKHKNINFNSDIFGQYRTLVKSNYIPNGYLISAKALKEIHPFTTDAPLEDWFLMLQLSKIGKFKFINKILFSYRWHENNTIKKGKLIQKMTIQTQQFEKMMISNFHNQRWNKIFDAATIEENIIFKIDPFFKLYKRKDIFTYKYIMKFFMIELVIKEKVFLTNKRSYLKLN